MAPHSGDSAQLIGRPVILELQICRLQFIEPTIHAKKKFLQTCEYIVPCLSFMYPKYFK